MSAPVNSTTGVDFANLKSQTTRAPVSGKSLGQAPKFVSRVQMMRDAVALTREKGHPDGGPLIGRVLEQKGADVTGGILNALKIIAQPYVDLDSRFFVELDFARPRSTDDLPWALVIANAQGGQYVLMTWTSRTVSFDGSQFGPPSIVVPLAAEDSWERLVEAIAKIVTDFDQNQRRAQVML